MDPSKPISPEGTDLGDWAERTLIQEVRGIERRSAVREGWTHYLAFQDHEPSGGGGMKRMRLGPAPVRIGRRAPCEILLPDAEVSGLHCEVRLQGQDVFVSDLGSTNGTFVNGRRVASRLRLSSGATLQVGRHFIKLETRDGAEFARAQELDRDLARAQHYVRSMLPPPLREGPVRVEWLYEPSTQVGGDGFGYYALDAHRVVGYLLDVAGHGVGAAMHLVTVMNTLRQRALPDTDFGDPAHVLSRLNAMFQMDDHDNMVFSIWYGVLDLKTCQLHYASAGHHPAYLLPSAGGPPQALKTARPVIGAVEPNAITYATECRPLAAGDRLYLFSDGAFEIATTDGAAWGLDDFIALLDQPGRADAAGEPERLFRQVRRVARPGPLDDDVSILIATLT